MRLRLLALSGTYFLVLISPHFVQPNLVLPRPLHPGPLGLSPALQLWPRPVLALTLCAFCALRPGSCGAAALLLESDAVAAISVLAEALPRTLVDTLRVADGRPGPARWRCQHPGVPVP